MKLIRVHADDLDNWLELLERFCDLDIEARRATLHHELTNTDSLSDKWHDVDIHESLSIRLAADPDTVEICVQLNANAPAAEQAETAATVLNHLRYRPVKKAAVDIRKMKILLVEQHAQFANVVIDQFMKDLNIEIQTSLQDAWTALSDGEFDVALISDKYDDGTGEELLTSIKSNNLTVKTVAIAAYEDSNLKLRDAGADAICSKMDFSDIQTVIKDLF